MYRVGTDLRAHLELLNLPIYGVHRYVLRYNVLCPFIFFFYQYTLFNTCSFAQFRPAGCVSTPNAASQSSRTHPRVPDPRPGTRLNPSSVSQDSGLRSLLRTPAGCDSEKGMRVETNRRIKMGKFNGLRVCTYIRGKVSRAGGPTWHIHDPITLTPALPFAAPFCCKPSKKSQTYTNYVGAVKISSHKKPPKLPKLPKL